MCLRNTFKTGRVKQNPHNLCTGAVSGVWGPQRVLESFSSYRQLNSNMWFPRWENIKRLTISSEGLTLFNPPAVKIFGSHCSTLYNKRRLKSESVNVWICVWVSRLHYLDDLARLHGQSGEVSPAMDGHSLPQDRVQALHLIPRQHAEPPTLIRRTTARHGDVNFQSPPPRNRRKRTRNQLDECDSAVSSLRCYIPCSWEPWAGPVVHAEGWKRRKKVFYFFFFFWWSQRCGGESGRDQPFPPVRADRIQSVWKEPIHKRV